MIPALHTFNQIQSDKLTDTICQTAITGLLYIERPTFADERGFFREPANLADIEAITGQPFRVRQWNHSHSHPRVMRGIHAEGWNKLITLTRGEAFCALVDLRPDSDTFLQVELLTLSGGTGSLYIPIGVGNAFAVISDEPVDYLYLVDRLYEDRDPAGDQAISMFDPDLTIPWPISDPIISQRDRDSKTVREIFPSKF